jgi:hypothetical protein
MLKKNNAVLKYDTSLFSKFKCIQKHKVMFCKLLYGTLEDFGFYCWLLAYFLQIVKISLIGRRHWADVLKHKLGGGMGPPDFKKTKICTF